MEHLRASTDIKDAYLQSELDSAPSVTSPTSARRNAKDRSSAWLTVVTSAGASLASGCSFAVGASLYASRTEQYKCLALALRNDCVLKAV